jgi:WD40 repeat protein
VAFSGRPVHDLAVDPQRKVILAAVGEKLYRSQALSATGPMTTTPFISLSLDPPPGHDRWILPAELAASGRFDALSIGEGTRASYHSTDAGSTWASAPAPICDPTHLAVRPGPGDIVAWGDVPGEPPCLLHVPAGGGPWSPVSPPSQLTPGSTLQPLHFDADGLILALQAPYDGADLLLRLDPVQEIWEALPLPGHRVLDVFADPSDPYGLYALTTPAADGDVEVWRIDRGLLDTQLVARAPFAPGGAPPEAHVVLANAGRWVVVTPGNGRVYETVDQGASWSPRCDLGQPVDAEAGVVGDTTARILLGGAGGLYACDLAPGSAQALASRPLSPPTVGPGGQLAYVEDGRLTVTVPGGDRTVVAESGVPHQDPPLWWSLDGRRLLYQLTDMPGPALRLWDAESGETLALEEQVPDLSQQSLGVVAAPWSPDGQRLLLFSTSAEPIEDSRLLVGYWVLDLEAGALWSVIDPGPYGPATWIDAETIRYDAPCAEGAGICPRRIRVGPPAEPLAPPVERVDPPAGMAFVTGAVTGRGIAYGVQPAGGVDGHVATVLVDTSAGVTQVLTRLLPMAWSPDGRLLAGPACAHRACALAVADVVSGTLQTIPLEDGGRLIDLAWAPGGTHLAVSVAGEAWAGIEIWDRVTGVQIEAIATGDDAIFTDLGWSSDGCRLIFAQRWRPLGGTRVGSVASVEAIWAVGPDWERRWRVVPPNTGEEPPDPCPASLLDGQRLIAYYGTPAGPGLGILGRHGVSETLTLLQEQMAAYQALDPEVEHVPVFHMVTTIADAYPGEDTDYNHRVAHDTIRPWIEAAREAGGWAILDIQPAHAEIDVELDLIEPMLWEPGVHLAVDPEFVMAADEDVPGTDLGRITGAQINRVQARLDRIARATGQRRVLVIHQFNDRMMARKNEILDYAFVDLVWDADGFGSPHPKMADYVQYSGEPGFDYGGFKIFYRYDTPVMTPEEVLGLDPPPALVIYQ